MSYLNNTFNLRIAGLPRSSLALIKLLYYILLKLHLVETYVGANTYNDEVFFPIVRLKYYTFLNCII